MSSKSSPKKSKSTKAETVDEADVVVDQSQGGEDAAPETPDHTGLEFNSDPGASRSTWIAGVLVLLIVGWMGSGFVIPSQTGEPRVARQDPKPVAVAVSASQAQTVQQFFQAEGQAQDQSQEVSKRQSRNEQSSGDQFPNDWVEWTIVISLVLIVAGTWGVIFAW